jgi:hypothetical protein
MNLSSGIREFIKVKCYNMKVIHRKLGKEKAYGLAHIDSNTIEIDSRLKPKHKLEITIHEALHILYPTDSETAIVRKSKRLCAVLWQEGYRKVEK